MHSRQEQQAALILSEMNTTGEEKLAKIEHDTQVPHRQNQSPPEFNDKNLHHRRLHVRQSPRVFETFETGR